MTSIVFLDPSLSLINVPLKLFPHFAYSILHLIQYPPEFFNISLTPTSLSIICPKESAGSLFTPILQELKENQGATIEKEEYVCLQIDGEGMSDGSRLIELTQPLAKAGVSILFITTYFSDYVLVASRQMKKVRKVLLEKGFSFQDLNGSFVASPRPSNSPTLEGNISFSIPESPPVETFEFDDDDDDFEDVVSDDNDIDDDDDDDDEGLVHSTESLTDRVAHEQGINTLQFLRTGKIPVQVAIETKLLMLGSSVQFQDYTIPLTKVFLSAELPAFFSITKAPSTSPSFLITQELAKTFDPKTLLGLDSAEVLIPIMLDLSSLDGVGGLGGCGIVCGVVDELMQRALRPSPSSMEQMLSKEELVMSYLSTVVTGNVLIRQQDVSRIGATGGECNVM